MKGGKSLENLIRRYAAYCLRFASQNIACNTLHTAEQRVCRRLLMAHDRAGRHDFLLTHEVLGQMLGVHRQAITPVARTLQAAKFIEYRRGVIKILNRKGLEDAGCECYEIAKTAYESIVMKVRFRPLRHINDFQLAAIPTTLKIACTWSSRDCPRLSAL